MLTVICVMVACDSFFESYCLFGIVMLTCLLFRKQKISYLVVYTQNDSDV